MSNNDAGTAKPFADEADQTRALLIGGAFAKQAEASRRLNVSQAQMSRVLGGSRRPSPDMLRSWDIELSQIARSGVADDPEFLYEPGTIQQIWGAQSTDSEEIAKSDHKVDERSRLAVPRARLLAVGAALGTLAFGLAIAQVRGGADAAEPVSSPTQLDGEMAACPVHFVDFVDGFEANFEPTSAVMVGAVVKSRSVYSWPCPIELGRAVFDGDMVLTPLLDRDDRRSFLVSISPTEAMVLSPEQWLSVLDAGTWAEDLGVTKPLPKRYEPATTDSAIVVAGGWRLVGPQRDQRHVFLPPAIYESWRSSGGAIGPLGEPVSNGYLSGGEIRFDFSGGYLYLSADDIESPEAEVALVADKSKGLPSPSSQPDLVVIGDGSTWLRDGGNRYWVPTPPLRSCLVNQNDEPIAGAGTALARLKYDGIAECEASES